ncbi:DUF6177 family protein [Streptantibioticus silvisoli]|uniref:DUF6177 family protein n=1 Tax=Streptantibioticus silvisoli TaxID=2705255 RepID=A0ABT6W486_9ACTN|nr:DUF6177 family protein [Streptantibioticus silvisoli]MDI5965536.1 DUF6177 family protein [Streptantibioticus silvisoli]
MTTDLIALTRRMPDPRTLAAALAATGPDLRLRSLGDGSVLQLCDEQGRPLLSVEAPIDVRVPGETARLLGADASSDGPVWWTEARAATGVPAAEALAATFVSHLAGALDGQVRPPDRRVPVSAALPETAVPPSAPEPVAAQPAVDVLTERAAVAIQDRPVIALTSWLADAYAGCAATHRALQIVTPPGSRLTMPLRTVLSGPPNRWVVRDEACGYYDGLTGAVLRWQDGHFRPPGDPESGGNPMAAAFTGPEAEGAGQVLLSFRTSRPADEEMLLGGALEEAFRILTGEPPAGWGTSEPAALPWSRDRLTRLARSRMPDGSWFTVVGGPDRAAIATLRVARTPDGVDEEAVLAVGHTAQDEIPRAGFHSLAAELTAHHGLVSLVAQCRAARADLTVPSHFEPVPVPLAFALGPSAVAEVGPDHARGAPIHPRTLSAPDGPGLYFDLVPSSGVPSAAVGYDTLQGLMRYLQGGGAG